MKINEVVIVNESETLAKNSMITSNISEGRKPKHKDKDHKKHKSKHKAKDDDDDADDLEDIENDKEDSEDEVPNILMQLRKAIDVDGKHPISFKDGDRVELSMDQITMFVQKYMKSKPAEKEKMQEKAVKSLIDFIDAIKMDVKKNTGKFT
jgi:hypothetical protein